MQTNSALIASGNFFLTPNVVFNLGLTAPALAAYEFLLCMENRNVNDPQRYTCCVSYAEIGGAISRDKRSVPKYVSELTEKRLVEVEPTMFYTRDGLKFNGRLRYRLLPISFALDYHYERELARLDREMEKQRVRNALAALGNRVS